MAYRYGRTSAISCSHGHRRAHSRAAARDWHSRSPVVGLVYSQTFISDQTSFSSRAVFFQVLYFDTLFYVILPSAQGGLSA